MNKKLVFLSLMMLILLPLLAFMPEALVGRAAWSEGTGYNLSSWESYNSTNWKGNSTGYECYFNYTQDINNFQSWSFKPNLDDFYFYGLWGISGIKQEFWIKIQNRNNASQYITGFFHHSVYFTIIGTLGYEAGCNFPNLVWFTRQVFTIGGTGGIETSVNITKWTNTQMDMQVANQHGGLAAPHVAHVSYAVPSGFFSNVTLSVWVYKKLQLATTGWVQGSKANEVIKTGSAISSLGGIQWGSNVLDFKISTWPSIVSMVTPGIILGGIAGVFAMAGSKLGGHGVAGFMIGSCIALVILAQSGLMPSWIFAVIVLIGAVGIYFWWK